MTKQQSKMVRSRILLIVGILLCSSPLALYTYHDKVEKDVLKYYQKSIQINDKSEYLDGLELAKEYNDSLYADVDADFTFLQDSYQDALNPLKNGMMGWIEIPKVNLNLPIYHGTSNEILAKGVGHLEMTSLPIGGINTRTVISGHRGLPTAQMFTRLDELGYDDLFYFHIGEDVLAYQIFQIEVIEPTEIEKLAIVPGEDLATLMTCTPYGINSHRLLLTGKRVNFDQQKYLTIPKSLPSVRELFITFFPLIILFVVFLSKLFTERKTREMKRIKKCLAILMCSLVMVVSAHASDQGKITIQFLNDLKHGEIVFEINQVATLNNGRFIFNEDYQNCNLDITQIKTAHDLAQAASILTSVKKEPDLTITTDINGKADLTDLDFGLYLITSNDYEEIMPTLVAIPHYDEIKEDYVYEITVSPKYQAKEIATGDESQLYFMLFIFIASLFGVGFLLKSRVDLRKNE